jgi:hypothetical protein
MRDCIAKGYQNLSRRWVKVKAGAASDRGLLSGLPQLFWNPGEGLVLLFLSLTFLAVELFPACANPLDTLIR